MRVNVKNKTAVESKSAYPMLLDKTTGFIDWVGNLRDAVVKTIR